MAELLLITPFIMTHDLEGSIAFFETVLGFENSFQMENYAFMKRTGGAVRLLEVEADCPIAEQMVYIDCSDVDAVFSDHEAELSVLPEGRVKPPFDQPYGMREFHVKDPDNCLLMFGEIIPPSP